jgi:hypothetical protein
VDSSSSSSEPELEIVESVDLISSSDDEEKKERGAKTALLNTDLLLEPAEDFLRVRKKLMIQFELLSSLILLATSHLPVHF